MPSVSHDPCVSSADADQERNAGFASGLREEVVLRFPSPVPMLSAIHGNTFICDGALLAEAIEGDAEILWQVGALSLAAAQRAAHDQAEILMDVFHAMRGSLAMLSSRAQGSSSSPLRGPTLTETIAGSLLAALAAAAEVAAQSREELSDIAAERMLNWTGTFGRFLGFA